MNKNLPATKAPSGVATDAPPDYLAQYAGRGSENVGRNDMTLPRVGLIQALSPQLKRNDPAYIDGAQMGDIFNTLTGELYGSSVYLVNCFFVPEVAVFRKRTAGGGFRGTFKTLSEAQSFIAAHPEKDVLEAIEQGVHYVLILDEEKNPISEAAIVFQSTKMKISRKWNALIKLEEAKGQPRFGKVYKLRTCEEKNEKGDFYNYVPPIGAGFVDEATAQAANNLYEAVSSGLKTVARDEHPEGAGDDIPY